jgi:NAD(P)-dependent dehydrogenase (short-subunit alcohol dehydrogenase family)
MTKTALVTGASTGIGRAIALELAKNNIKVILVARREDKLKETQNLIKEFNSDSEIIPTDLNNVESINSLLTQIKERVSQIDILVNVAAIWHGKDGVYAGKDFETFDQKVVLDTFMVGLTAPTLLCHGLIPLMKAKSKIINISGTFEDGAKGWLPYYVSKKGIEELTIGLSQELAEKDIQVNCISPSDTASEEYAKYFPQYIDQSLKPEDIAKKVLELTQNDTMTGEIIILKKS